MKAKRTFGMTAALAAVCLLAACGSVASSVEEYAENTANSEESFTQSISEENTAPEINYNGEVRDGLILLPDGRAMFLFAPGYERGRNYAATVSKYKEELGEYVNVYSMVVPSAAAFYMPEKYFDEGVTEREQPHIDDINDHLNGVIPMDVYDTLKDHVDEDIYFRTDHHWTSLAAYYAAQSFAETALVPFDDFSDYSEHSVELLGGLYGSADYNPNMKEHPDKFVWYVPKREVTATYFDRKGENGQKKNYFDEPRYSQATEWIWPYNGGGIVHIDTELDTGRRLMIIGDSFTHPFTPWLFGSFDDIWLVDMRGCDISTVQLAKDNDVTDLLFCSSIDSAAGSLQAYLEKTM